MRKRVACFCGWDGLHSTSSLPPLFGGAAVYGAPCTKVSAGLLGPIAEVCPTGRFDEMRRDCREAGKGRFDGSLMSASTTFATLSHLDWSKMELYQFLMSGRIEA